MSSLSSKIRNNLKDSEFADPKDRKLPLNDKAHVRNAAARENQTKDMSPAERKLAHTRIKNAEKKMGIKSK